MNYRIESIEIFVRETPPDRMSFAIGKRGDSGETAATKKRRPRAILFCRLRLSSDDGREAIGCSGDRPSFGWLDKRPGLEPDEKLTLLLDLVEGGRRAWLEAGRSFSTPFALWLEAGAAVRSTAASRDAEELMGSYASALFERAVLDAFCRIEDTPFFEMVWNHRLGIEAAQIHPELDDRAYRALSPKSLQTRFWIRHTVGLSDPIDDSDWPAGNRIGDGEPETLAEYVARDGLRYLKIKVSGDAEADLERLGRIWNRVLAPQDDEPVVTLDGNEAWSDIDAFAEFVEQFERDLPGLFDHTAFIEQPLNRALTHDPSTAPTVRAISEKKFLVIDEADGRESAFREAFAIGYSGCSHKNCKGVFKSLLNHALCGHLESSTGREAFLSGEDLSNMPLIPLHQDFAVLAVLGIEHCERNGHHYAYGLSHLEKSEKLRIARELPDSLYVLRNGEWFLRIEDGVIATDPIHHEAFGSLLAPAWDALTPLADWRTANGA